MLLARMRLFTLHCAGWSHLFAEYQETALKLIPRYNCYYLIPVIWGLIKPGC